MTLKLMKCPLCGAKPEWYKLIGFTYVSCSKYSPEHRVQIGAKTPDEAAANWNTRKFSDEMYEVEETDEEE